MGTLRYDEVLAPASTILSQAADRHEQIRRLLEQRHPECRVVQIDEHVRSAYTKKDVRDAKTDADLEYVRWKLEVEYDVELAPFEIGSNGYVCQVFVGSDGSVRLVNEQSVIALW